MSPGLPRIPDRVGNSRSCRQMFNPDAVPSDLRHRDLHKDLRLVSHRCVHGLGTCDGACSTDEVPAVRLQLGQVIRWPLHRRDHVLQDWDSHKCCGGLFGPGPAHARDLVTQCATEQEVASYRSVCDCFDVRVLSHGAYQLANTRQELCFQYRAICLALPNQRDRRDL